MATDIAISNQGLQLLGASRIVGFNDGTVNGDAVGLIYEDTRDALQRDYPWTFCIKRVQLSTLGTTPLFDRARAFVLPGDYLSPLAPYPEANIEQLDWIIEAGQLITNDSSPLDFRYVAKVDDPDLFDPLFRKALSAALALELVEVITQSNTKLQNITSIFDRVISKAHKSNAIEKVNHLPPEDSWVSVRRKGRDNTRTWH